MANRVARSTRAKSLPGDDATIVLLRVIVRLLLRKKAQETTPMRQQIEMLDEMGIRPAEIAKIIGRTNTYVGKELVGIRRGKGKRRG